MFNDDEFNDQLFNDGAGGSGVNIDIVTTPDPGVSFTIVDVEGGG